MLSGNLKVLICDDSALMRKKLRDSLMKKSSFEVFEAADGQTAVNMYREYMPELVFMDIVMPVKDGIDALKEIKSLGKNVKIVIVSSSGTQSNLRKSIEAGADDFIQKPWEQSQIDSIIEKLLKEREGRHV